MKRVKNIYYLKSIGVVNSGIRYTKIQIGPAVPAEEALQQAAGHLHQGRRLVDEARRYQRHQRHPLHFNTPRPPLISATAYAISLRTDLNIVNSFNYARSDVLYNQNFILEAFVNLLVLYKIVHCPDLPICMCGMFIIYYIFLS